MAEPKFPELPVEVQVALINAASKMSAAKITVIGDEYNREFDFFKKEYARICDAIYKENRGR